MVVTTRSCAAHAAQEESRDGDLPAFRGTDEVYPLRELAEGCFAMESFWRWRPGRKHTWFPHEVDERVTSLVITVPSIGDCELAKEHCDSEYAEEVARVGDIIAEELQDLRERFFPNLERVVLRTEVWFAVGVKAILPPFAVYDCLEVQCDRGSVELRSCVVENDDLATCVVGYGEVPTIGARKKFFCSSLPDSEKAQLKELEAKIVNGDCGAAITGSWWRLLDDLVYHDWRGKL